MASLFTTDTLLKKRNKQKAVYQDTYDDCSFAFEFVPMDAVKKFNKQAIMEAYVEIDGFEKVDAVGYLDISYSKIDKFNRLFYFISDDADPSIHNMSSLENINYGILGDNGINPFNVSDQEFAFSNSKIKAGYANPALNYADNTYLRHDYIRYTAKAITGGYALSDVFSNEPELIKAVGDLDLPFNLDFASRINDLSGCILKGSENNGWKTCKSLVTGLLDLANETDTTTTRFKRGTKFLSDLAEQSINTFESEKNVSQGEFWVKFHPGDAIAFRLTYNPENGDNQPAKNSLGFLGENKLNDRSYKIYLRFNRASLDEAIQGMFDEFTHVINYRSEADKAIGQQTVVMPTLLIDSLNSMSLAKNAISKSFKKANDLKDQPPTPIALTQVSNYTNASTASNEVALAEEQLKVALGSIGDIKVELESSLFQLNNTSSYTTKNEFPSVYIKTDSLKGIMTNVAESVKNVAEIVTARSALTNVSNVMPKTYNVLERTQKYAELKINDFTPLLDSYVANMSSMIHLLNVSASTELTNASSRMDQNMSSITSEKRNTYKEFVFASVAQTANSCREHSRLANEYSTVVEKLNDDVFHDFNNTLSVVENVTNVSRKLNTLSSVLTTLETSVVNASGYAGVSDPPKTVVSSLNTKMIFAREHLVPSSELTNYSRTATIRNLDSKLKNMQSVYHATNTKRVADMWAINEEVAKSEAAKVIAMTAAKNAVLSDALAKKETSDANKKSADASYTTASSSYSAAELVFSAAYASHNAAITTASAANSAVNVAKSVRDAKQNTANAYDAALVIARANAVAATSKLTTSDKNAADALALFNKVKSDANVLTSTASTLRAVAVTDYEKTTATAAEAEALAARQLSDAKEILSNTAAGVASTDKIDLEDKTRLEVAAILQLKSENEALTAAEIVLETKKKLLDEAYADVSVAQTAKDAAETAKNNAFSEKNSANITKNDANNAQNAANLAYHTALNVYNNADEIDEVNADARALVVALSDGSVVGQVDAAIAVAAEKCLVNSFFNETTHKFNINCGLSPEFKSLTIDAFPGGVFYLRNLSNSENLGNNTNVANNYANQYIGGPIEGNVLHFVNRMPTTAGAKLLQVYFFDAVKSKTILGKVFTLFVTKDQFDAHQLHWGGFLF